MKEKTKQWGEIREREIAILCFLAPESLIRGWRAVSPPLAHLLLDLSIPMVTAH